MSELEISSEVLPDSSIREVAIKELDKLCRECVEASHAINRALADHNDRLVGRYEERIYNLIDQIHNRQRYYDQDHGIYLAVMHTAQGCPIRVNPTWKKRIWE